jgi:hypothetical protein
MTGLAREWLRWNWPKALSLVILAGCLLLAACAALYELGQPHWSGGPSW